MVKAKKKTERGQKSTASQMSALVESVQRDEAESVESTRKGFDRAVRAAKKEARTGAPAYIQAWILPLIKGAARGTRRSVSHDLKWYRDTEPEAHLAPRLKTLLERKPHRFAVRVEPFVHFPEVPISCTEGGGTHPASYSQTIIIGW